MNGILKFLSDSKATEPDPPQTPLSDDRPFLRIVANLHWLQTPIAIANRCSNHYCSATIHPLILLSLLIDSLAYYSKFYTRAGLSETRLGASGRVGAGRTRASPATTEGVGQRVTQVANEVEGPGDNEKTLSLGLGSSSGGSQHGGGNGNGRDGGGELHLG